MWTSEARKIEKAIDPLKDQFALEWLRLPSSPFEAALRVFGLTQAAQAAQASREWINDPYVINKRNELIEEFGEDYFLPSKSDIARKILDAHENTSSNEVKLKALRLYGELMGFITKDQISSKSNQPVYVTLTEQDAKL